MVLSKFFYTVFCSVLFSFVFIYITEWDLNQHNNDDRSSYKRNETYTHIYRRIMKQKTHVYDFSAIMVDKVETIKKNGLQTYFISLFFFFLFSIIIAYFQ